MADIKNVDLKEFEMEPLFNFDKNWALLSCKNNDKFNMMTISWGEIGTLWSKPVITIYVKPIRYTNSFMENSDYFTVSFFEEKFRQNLLSLGTLSGKNVNKEELISTKIITDDKYVTYEDALLTFKLKKIYSQQLKLENINNGALSESELNHYYSKEPLHIMYIGEILEIDDKR